MFTWHWIDSSICSIAQHLRPPELCDTERRSTGKYVFAPDVHGVAVLSEVWSRCRGNAPPDSVTTSWSSRCCWHQRRSSGVKLGSLAPLRSVCWDKQSAGRRRRRKKNFTLKHIGHCRLFPSVHSTLDLCTSERRRISLRLSAACSCCYFCA